MNQPVTFAVKADGLHVYQGKTHLVIPREFYAVLLQKLVKHIPWGW